MDATRQQSLNQLLQWGIKNSSASQNDPTTQPTDQTRDPNRGLNPDVLAQLLGGPSDADRMREAMTAILAPLAEVDMENKLIAWDNLEQLIENLDNANNLESLGMWPPLISQLESSEADNRRMAAWCCGTAVQNNIKSQERLLAHGGVPKLVELAVGDGEKGVRRKAVGALSSAARNFQEGMDELMKCVPGDVWKGGAVEAGDMEAVDEVIGRLREIAGRE